MTDWNEHFAEIINHDPAEVRFQERYATASPEVLAIIEEMRQIEANVGSVELLKGKYKTRWGIRNLGFENYGGVELHFIKPKDYPFRLPQFLISFYRNVGTDLKHRKFSDTNEYDTVTVEEATRLALAELKNRL